MLKVFVLITIVTSIFIFTSCESDNPTEAPSYDYAEAFYPLAVGNSWSYVDSVEMRDTTIINSYSYKIVSTREDGLGLWWRFDQLNNNDLTGLMSHEYMERNDTVYTFRQDSDSLTVEYFNHTGLDTVTFYKTIGFETVKVSVFRLTEPFTTPAGTFNNALCFFFSSDLGYFWHRIILAPKVGLLFIEQRDVAFNFVRRTTLINYSLK